MATLPGIKYDDGLPAISANCFPVRTFLRHDVTEEADGAWLVAQRAEQRKRFKAILCTKPKTYARIKEERRRAEQQGTTISEQLQAADDHEEEEKDVPMLDGFFLMRHCCVDDPSDLCSVNISGKEMTDVKEEDLALFDNVAYVNASENYLPLEAFRGFPILRELEMPLNALRSIRPNIGDYPLLEVLDVSYNNLSQDDILTLGLLSNLKVLHLTGNGLVSLPPNMAMPHFDEKTKTEHLRFSKLEILLLDDNRLEDVSVFAALAGLSSLKHLNLEKNELYYVPMLKSIEGKLVQNESEKDARKLRRSAEKEGRRSARGTRSKDPTPRHPVEKKEREGTTDAPLPTPVPTGEDSQKGSGKMEGDSSVQPDLLKEDFTDLSRQITDIDLEKEITLPVTDEGNRPLGDGSGLPPFPDLRALNLAYNKIEDEEALLAVAAWPMLVELIIHNNPLTTENSGDPPLLQRFLGERLGIRIKRKKEADVVKPPVEVKMKKSRHVTTVVPKIPKMNVDDLLMLEAPKPPPAPKPERTRTHSNLDPQKPLPAIPASPVDGQGQRSQRETGGDESSRPVDESQGQEQQDNDAFFMTQVDDQEEEWKKAKKESKVRKRKQKEKMADDKYKGYEILLDAEDDTNYSPPKDMHGTIKALKYALGHELVYRDPAVRLDRISKPVEPYRKLRLVKTEYLKGAPRVSQGQKKEEMLAEMRDRVTTEEAELQDVLQGGNKDLRKRFPDSDRLLSEIQRRYNAVRVNSMKEAKDAKKMLAGTLQEVNKSAGTRKVKMEV
ncbi:X-ray radiation resistance-associated protein 1-like isoform X2 [Ruditapes philippinarum]|uniref:X-ray radiation resistance-associated protein 1-like isoform X2 n=1 Tax=Ruditapes philippinarum TaxID=129788 RepID=UPI00295A6DE5|nr:X-ray radiation resistance-associated protein 1-like isoform X2 [Ruditapes philippinarum]